MVREAGRKQEGRGSGKKIQRSGNKFENMLCFSICGVVYVRVFVGDSPLAILGCAAALRLRLQSNREEWRRRQKSLNPLMLYIDDQLLVDPNSS